MRLSHVPLRVATGAFIINAGLTKLGADDDDSAKMLHDTASATYPFLASVEPRTFVKGLGASEVLVGGALLAPMVPAWLAGAALTAFSGGLLGVYLKTPGMTMQDSVRPTQKGTPLAKDVWMLGSGLSLLIDGLTPKRRKHKPTRRTATSKVG